MKEVVSKWNSLDGKTHLIEYKDGSIKRFDGALTGKELTNLI